jgi:hypothetical protein
MNGDEKNAYRLLVERPEIKRPLLTPRRERVDNIEVDLEESVGWTALAQDRDQCRYLVNGKDEPTLIRVHTT